MSPATLAARDSVAVFPLERTLIEITGRDRAKFLHNFCTNNILALQPGQGCEAFLCNAKGRVLGHGTVFVTEDALWFETVPNAGSRLLSHLERYTLSDDVQLRDRSTELRAVIVVGPRAIDVICGLLGETEPDGPRRQSIESLSVPGISPGSADGCGLRVVDWLGRRCYLPIAKVDDVEQGLLAMTALGAVQGTSEDWEALRIDAGFPSYGIDITEDHLPQEVGRTEKCVSFTKGCYLGQEPIARLDAMGHTNRELRRLIGDAAAMPPAGDELRDPATQQPVGHITSAAANPYGDGVVALGYLKTRWQTPGTRVTCGTGEFTVR